MIKIENNMKKFLETQNQSASDLHSIAQSLDNMEQYFILIGCSLLIIAIVKVVEIFTENI